MLHSSDTSASMSVLAQVVASRDWPPEPVATDALTYLLRSSPGAGGALADWVGSLLGEPLSDLTFSTQVSANDLKGVPDLIGANNGGVRLVGEAKFDATLTKVQQSDAYLERLPKGQPG